MSVPLVPPQETPPVEGSTSSAHSERPDRGVWEHPWLPMVLVLVGSAAFAAFFAARIAGF
ncbi:hypothetical protein BJP40_12835 [Streptomyces sp. CC53]|uniref:DUF6480 family protein n=1 Tax=unclassified Streptomyces TaxID=2593676 RepID=UPI0008DE35C1|nr:MULTISPECIES: DUF6480 family protein [unclassified Streptomyces]OII59717.1 hypothetical protein BJP40_12835 [Streptomyces sp. CC53]